MEPESRHVSVMIEQPAAVVYDYASNPVNLPLWAAGLTGTDLEEVDGQWMADSPMGRVVVSFAPHNEFGVLDHVVTLPSGENVYNPLRVIPNGDGSEVVFTVRGRAGMSSDELAKDAAAVAADLDTLKRILEAH